MVLADKKTERGEDGRQREDLEPKQPPMNSLAQQMNLTSGKEKENFH